MQQGVLAHPRKAWWPLISPKYTREVSKKLRLRALEMMLAGSLTADAAVATGVSQGVVLGWCPQAGVLVRLGRGDAQLLTDNAAGARDGQAGLISETVSDQADRSLAKHVGVLLRCRHVPVLQGCSYSPHGPAPIHRAGPGTPPRVKPVLVAHGPGQGLSWDITDLPSVFTGVAYELSAVMDIYGRQIVGHCLHEREADHLAVGMFADAIGAVGPPEVVHSDSGPAICSNALWVFLTGSGSADVIHPPLGLE